MGLGRSPRRAPIRAEVGKRRVIGEAFERMLPEAKSIRWMTLSRKLGIEFLAQNERLRTMIGQTRTSFDGVRCQFEC